MLASLVGGIILVKDSKSKVRGHGGVCKISKISGKPCR